MQHLLILEDDFLVQNKGKIDIENRKLILNEGQIKVNSFQKQKASLVRLKSKTVIPAECEIIGSVKVSNAYNDTVLIEPIPPFSKQSPLQIARAVIKVKSSQPLCRVMNPKQNRSQ